jgi:gas vesicle protein
MNEMMILIGTLVGLLLGFVVAYFITNRAYSSKIREAEEKAKNILKEAEKEANNLKKENCSKLKKSGTDVNKNLKTNISKEKLRYKLPKNY